MKVCFIGHSRVFSSGLKVEVTKCIEKIIESNDVIDFYFRNADSRFNKICVSALQDLKSKHNTKTITMICVQLSGTFNNVFDKSVCPVNSGKRVAILDKQLCRWMIDNAETCVLYIFPELHGNDADYLIRALNRGIKVINLATDARLLHECRGKLIDKEKDVLMLLENGETTKSIAATRNVTKECISQLRNKAVLNLMILAEIHDV